MRAFLINLDRSGARLAHMEGEFSRVGVAFTRFAGVDGGQLTPDEIDHFVRLRPAPGRWLPGEIGCFLSHFAVWKTIAAGREDAVAVFEDDIHLAADLKALLAAPVWIPAEADIVRLEANRPMVLRSGRRIPAAPKRRVYRAASGSWGSAGYIITRAAAQMLVETDHQTHHCVDVFLFKPGRSRIAEQLRCHQVAPAVCVQDSVYSLGTSGLDSVIGVERRTPIRPRTDRLSLRSLLPWKKKSVVFRP